MHFSKHGNFEILISEKIVACIIEGPYNEETVLDYIDCFKQKASPLLGGDPWASLMIPVADALPGPESKNLMIDFSKWRSSKNCSQIVWTMEHMQGRDLVLRTVWRDVYEKQASLKGVDFFRSTDEALAFLRDLGIPHSLDTEGIFSWVDAFRKKTSTGRH